MQVEPTLSQLGHLGDGTGHGDARHRMAAQVFQHAAHEVAHVDQRHFGQVVQLLHRDLRGIAGGAGDVIEAQGARHVDAFMDRGDPGRAGIGNDDSGGSQDRQAADDAEPRVHGAPSQCLAVLDRDLDDGIGRTGMNGRHLGDRLADHPARYRIDRRLAHRHRQAGQRHHADARAGTEDDAAAGGAETHGRAHQGAVGDVGIVAGILDHAGGGRVAVQPGFGQGEARPLAARQGDLDRIGEAAAEQGVERRLGRRRRAASRGPAAAQRTCLFHRFLHAPGYSRGRTRCHRRTCR